MSRPARRSLILATAAAFFSTACAVPAALATTRQGSFRGYTFVFALINQPLMVPEIVTAVALLIVFAAAKVATGYTGFGYLILAHTAFCLPFAYMPIRARLQGMNLSLEQAGADLYATPWRTFRHITLPALGPTMFMVSILTMAGYFQLFAEPYVMTQGGPLQSTVSVLYFMYEQGFKWWNLGSATAVAFVLFVLMFGVTLLQMRLAERGLEE